MINESGVSDAGEGGDDRSLIRLLCHSVSLCLCSVVSAWEQCADYVCFRTFISFAFDAPLFPGDHKHRAFHLSEASLRRGFSKESRDMRFEIVAEIGNMFPLFFPPFLCVSKSVSSFSHFCKGLLSATLWLLLAIPSRVYDFRRSVSENAFRWISINVSALRKVLLYRIPFLTRNTSLSLW